MDIEKNLQIFHSNSTEETRQIAENFALDLKMNDIVIFNGELGVGKTEFIRTICQLFGVEQVITSPSFTIINEYECFRFDSRTSIYHIDLYRIKKQSELIEMGFHEIISTKNSLKFIEWAENSFDMLPNFNHKITLTANPDNETSRTIQIETF